MTTERIAELRALAEAATPGPWEIIKFDGPMSEETICRTKDAAPYEQMVWREGSDYDDYGQHPSDEDAAFIAAARTALPEALNEIERLWLYIESKKMREGI